MPCNHHLLGKGLLPHLPFLWKPQDSTWLERVAGLDSWLTAGRSMANSRLFPGAIDLSYGAIQGGNSSRTSAPEETVLCCWFCGFIWLLSPSKVVWSTETCRGQHLKTQNLEMLNWGEAATA